MDDTGSLSELDSKNLYKRPGPRLSACQWCGKVSCNHCRCTGQANCSHAPGEMCKNQRYKRRLVCNPCEKNKLKYRQMCQHNAEKKQEAARLKIQASNSNRPSYTESMQVNTEEILPHATLGPSPNIAVMFYKTRSLLTLLPVSSFQGTLSHLRSFIDSLMLLTMNVHYYFIKDNAIIANEEEALIPSVDIVREYVFPFPINCTRCILIHFIPQKMVPVTQPILPPTQNPLTGMWGPGMFNPQQNTSNSLVYSQNPLISQAQPIPPTNMPPTSTPSTLPEKPGLQPTNPMQPLLIQTTVDPSQKQFPRLSGDSAQWQSLPVNEVVLSSASVPPTELPNPIYNQYNRPSEGVPVFREEGVSNDFLQRNSFSDFSFAHSYGPSRVYPRQSASSDLNWPVFPPRSEEVMNPVFMDTMEKQRNSLVSLESMKLTVPTVPGLKRDYPGTKKAEEEKEEKEENKSTDRLSMMASLAKKELKSREEE